MNEEGLLGRGMGQRMQASWAGDASLEDLEAGFRPRRLTEQPWAACSTFWSLSCLTGKSPADVFGRL